MSVCKVSVYSRAHPVRLCECFPFCVLGARIGLSVTVKWGGVGDDRCRRREEKRECERDGWKSERDGAEEEEESEVWAANVEVLFFSQMWNANGNAAEMFERYCKRNNRSLEQTEKEMWEAPVYTENVYHYKCWSGAYIEGKTSQWWLPLTKGVTKIGTKKKILQNLHHNTNHWLLHLHLYNEVRIGHLHTWPVLIILSAHSHLSLFCIVCFGLMLSLLLLPSLDSLPKGLEDDGHEYFTKLHSQVINNKMPYSYKYSKNTAGLCLFSGALKIHTHLENR